MSTATPSWLLWASWASSILILAALWLGVVGMAKGRRGGAWWVLLIGLILLTAGSLAWAYGSYLVSNTLLLGPATAPDGSYVGPDPTGMMLSGFGSMMTVLGTFTFGLGFALHGLRVARTRARLAELEQVTAAMSEELERLRKGGAA